MSSVVKVKKPVVIGGKLKFKGSSTSEKKRKVQNESSSSSSTKIIESNKTDNKTDNKNSTIELEEFLTEAQKRQQRQKLETEKRDFQKLVTISHRERMETFNVRLSTMTEHNDLPRISAAGNG